MCLNSCVMQVYKNSNKLLLSKLNSVSVAFIAVNVRMRE